MSENETKARVALCPSRAITTLLMIALAGLISISCGGGGGSGGEARGEWNQMDWDQGTWG